MGELIDRSNVQKEIAKAQITINADPCFKAIAEIVVSEMAKAVHKAVDSVPAVDAVPVIRCKDCAFCRPRKMNNPSEARFCADSKWCMALDDAVFENDFCSYGSPVNKPVETVNNSGGVNNG